MAQPICWLQESDRQLYWAPQSACQFHQNVVVYTTDDKPEFAYNPLNRGRDFGPLDLTATVIYCRWVDSLVQSPGPTKAFAHIAADQIESWSNTVTLCGAYLVLAKGYSAAQAFQPFQQLALRPFLDCRGDATLIFEDTNEPYFQLHIIDVLAGLQHARDLGWLDYRTFQIEVHTQMLRPEYGDMTWLLKDKALAMASPWTRPHDTDNHRVCTPEDMLSFFQANKVGVVIQCNYPRAEETGERQELLSYDPQRFQNRGIRHVWLPFEDGGCPTVDVIQRFLSTCESQTFAFAVHCRSGLGRTATLIGAYAIRHFGFTARSFVGWSRVCRPGTVHGSQQQYLVNLEPYLRMGAPKALSTLTSTEQLKLLPKRELRFFALDLNISSEQTQNRSDDEIIQMILEAREQRSGPGQHVSQALRPPDPAQHRVLQRSMVPAGLEVDESNCSSPIAPTISTPRTSKPPSPVPVPSDFLWYELERYLLLLPTAAPEGAWHHVAEMVKQLREKQTEAENNGQIDPVKVKRFLSKSSQASQEAELERLKIQTEQTKQMSKAKELELDNVLKQVHKVQRSCSQLRVTIAKGQGDIDWEYACAMTSQEQENTFRKLRDECQQLREECERQKQDLQNAKERLNEPWESAKTSLDRLRSRLQVVP